LTHFTVDVNFGISELAFCEFVYTACMASSLFKI